MTRKGSTGDVEQGGTAEHELKANAAWNSRHVADRGIFDDPGSFRVITEACLSRARPAED